MEEEVFTKQPSSLPYILTPALIATFTVTLLCQFVIYPLLIPVLVPGYKSLGRKRSHFFILLSSTIHAAVCSSLSCYILMFGKDTELLKSPLGLAKSPLEFTTIQISLGYYTADIIVRLQHPSRRKFTGIVFHHVIAATGQVIILYYQGIYAYFMFFLLTTELATPLLNIHMAFHLLGPPYKNSLWYRMVSFGQVISFFCLHILLIPLYWYQYLTAINHHLSVIVPLVFRAWSCIFGVILDVMCVYWFSKMIRGTVFGT